MPLRRLATVLLVAGALLAPVAAAAADRLPAGYLTTRGNQIVDASGKPVKIRAVGWSGMAQDAETMIGDYELRLPAAVAMGFNTVKIIWSDDNLTVNNLRYLDKVMKYGDSLGLKFVLTHQWQHQNQANSEANALWYDVNSLHNKETYVDKNIPLYGQTAVRNNLVRLAKRYAGKQYVIGIELWNEVNNGNAWCTVKTDPCSRYNFIGDNKPAVATWGDGDRRTDLKLAAETLGNAVHAVNPNLLIFVDGMFDYGNQPGSLGIGATNLGIVLANPANRVTLTVPNKVVYAFHDYPEYVQDLSKNTVIQTPADWHTMFGALYEAGLPVFMSEGALSRTNWTPALHDEWKSLLAYMNGNTAALKRPAGGQGIGFTIWSLHRASEFAAPYSDMSLLCEDQSHPVPRPMSALRPYLPGNALTWPLAACPK